MRWGISSETSYLLEAQDIEARKEEKRRHYLHRLLVEVSNWPHGMPQKSKAARIGHEQEGDINYLLMFGLVDEGVDEKLGDKRYFITRKGRDELGRSSAS